MATLTLNPLFRTINGRLGDIMFYNSDGRLYARAKARTVNPDTEAQRIARRTFGDAVRSWQSLSADEQQRYNKKARRVSKKGYNLYISIYMKNNTVKSENRNGGKGLYLASTAYPAGVLPVEYSVAGAFHSLCSIYSPSIHNLHSASAG